MVRKWVVLALALLPGAVWAQSSEVSAEAAEAKAGDVPVLAGPASLEPLPAPRVDGGLAGTPPVMPGARPSFAVLPMAVSVVPGLLLHGLGPLVEGDTGTAKRLFLMEGAGLGMLAVGGVPIALSGASRRIIGPMYAVTLTGVGLFSISTLSNLYAAVSPAFPPGLVPQRLPPLELEVGYQHVMDPAFEYRHFLSVGALARLERVRLEAGAKVSPDDGNLRVRVGGAYRLVGAPEAARGGADGTALDLEAAALVHRYPTEDFTLGGGELFLRGRYDMARVSPKMAGSFAELGLGYAMQRYAYSGPVDDILFEQLLYTFGFGVYLGRGGPFRGEALLYYDHRKDDFPGGIKAGGGVPGYFGLRGRMLLTERWGVSADMQVGSALVGRLSLVYALGGES
ncbi:hypothetical protein [Vitiosangium sp. GDMCC 1.1324]|uniref:hypothetical protein n=1 Tax=Vitiosangium sp. (strain GDMCC 1.1324) TaxID=2138576 RepID=UPI000D357B5E|nr:hypothetical protein [Vitiosangium sp. GDMCC 1.1324]PTL84740.1 hypothetical protein DAT35_06660 [Vitiosangium sp. GDMCC 1.1324]